MGKIIAITNQKGGVSKTTTTYNLGSIAARHGKKTLLVDFDSQASLTISMGYEAEDFENNIATLLDNYIARPSTKAPIYESIYESDIPNLYFIPAIIDLAVKEMQLNGITSKETVLKRVLKDVAEDFDYIIIDTMPSLGNLTINALSAADYVLIPTEADYLAYKAIKSLTGVIADIKELINPSLTIIGVLVTKYEAHTTKARDVMEALKQNYNVIGTINKSVEITKGILEGKPIVELKKLTKPGTEIVESYTKVFHIIEELNKEV